MHDDFEIDSKLCGQFRDYRLIDCSRIEMRLCVTAASHEHQRGGNDYGVPGFHNQSFSKKSAWELGANAGLFPAPETSASVHPVVDLWIVL
jgi:hypothetical protein